MVFIFLFENDLSAINFSLKCIHLTILLKEHAYNFYFVINMFVWHACLQWNYNNLVMLFQGIMIYGVTTFVQMLVIQKKDPVFVTAFRPLSTILVTLMGLVILRDALFLGRYAISSFNW